MKKKLINKFLILAVMITLIPTNILAYESSHSSVINQNQTVDILITADDTYNGNLPDFKTDLSAALEDVGLNGNDVRISTADTDISLSNFDDWFVYDHYYHPSFAQEGTAPTDWNDFSGRHPYDYYQEENVARSYISEADFLATEAVLHDELWDTYQMENYACQSSLDSLYPLAALENPYDNLSTETKAEADAAIVALINNEMPAGMPRFQSLTDVLEYLKEMIAQETFNKLYSDLTDEEKNNEDFLATVNGLYSEVVSRYYEQVSFNLLGSSQKKSMCDDYLLENYIKDNYTVEEYVYLSDEEKAADLKIYKDSYYDSRFAGYMDTESLETFASMTEERKAIIISDYYYADYIIHNQGVNIAIDNYYGNDHLPPFYTDITSAGSLSGIHYRDKHIYTGIDDQGNASMTFLGYSAPGYKDFMIYPTTMENEKKVTFDIDASKVSTHTLEGSGFLINSGIDTNGYIKGYMLFYLFDYGPEAGTVYLLKLNDNVTADDLHNNPDDLSILDFASTVASQPFTFDTTSNKKKINVTITPESVNCVETDYTDADGTEFGSSNTLFASSADYDAGLNAVALDSTDYNGFGPFTSYTSHNCDQLSSFTFSNLKMSYESSMTDALRSATYVDHTQKVYVVLTGSEETDTHNDLNSYYELLTRLNQDKIFYVTTGGEVTINANGGNGLNLADSIDKSADVAEYISRLKKAEVTWQSTLLPSGDNVLPVAVFDITDYNENQILQIDREHLGGSGITLKFGNIEKSVALATIPGDLSYNYSVYDPSGNPIDLEGSDENELTLSSRSDVGFYTFVLTANDGSLESKKATRTLTFVGDNTAPTISQVSSGVIPYSGRNITINLSDHGSGVAAYAIGQASDVGEAIYSDEIVLPQTTEQQEIALALDSGVYKLYVRAYDACGNENEWIIAVDNTDAPDSVDAEAAQITAQPSDATLRKGETAMLTIAANGSGTLNYQWYSNEANSNSGGSIIGNATDTAYSIPTTTAGTTYYYCVVTNTDNRATGNKMKTTTSSAAKVIVSDSSSHGSSSGLGSAPSDGSAPVIVNGESQNAGTASDSNEGGQTVTTVTVDSGKLEKILETKGYNATVIIPVATGSDVAVGVLTGQMVKNMESLGTTIEVQAGSTTYTLPSSEINIDAISEQLGHNVALADIKVQIEISKPSSDTIKVVESAEVNGKFTLVVPAVEFTISCTYNGKTVEVSNFNAFVERTIAIPDGVNPNKITTGVVINPDGTVRHVPTKIIVIDGKYYAKINSLTNSTYAVVWNPIAFKDVKQHWAKDAINDMGSRMVISGVGNNMFEPEREITRAEFAAIVVRSLGLEPGTGDNAFTDVISADWYGKYIETAYAYGIISGYDKEQFRPMERITREQAMTMIARAMKIIGLNVELKTDEADKLFAEFGDSQLTAAWSKESVAACVKADIVSGKSSKTLAPKDEITRAEVAEIVKRLLQKSGLI